MKRGEKLLAAFIIITIFMGALIWFSFLADLDKSHLDTEASLSVAVYGRFVG